MSTISLDAGGFQKAAAPSAGLSYIRPFHSEFPHWVDGVIRAAREDLARRYFADPSIAAGSRPRSRRGRLSSLQNAKEQ